VCFTTRYLCLLGRSKNKNYPRDSSKLNFLEGESGDQGSGTVTFFALLRRTRARAHARAHLIVAAKKQRRKVVSRHSLLIENEASPKRH